MPARVSEQVVNRVRELWAKTPQASGHAVANRYFRIYGDKDIKLRKIISIVSAAKKAAPEKPFSFAEWQPWGDPQESPEETYFLLLLHYIKQAESGMGLYQHEARWGRQLKIGVAGLSPYSQYKLVYLYSIREVVNHYLKRPQYTADLDGFVAFKPWRPYHNWAAYYIYLFAVGAGVVPFPEVDPRPESGEDIDPALMPGVQFPEGPGPELYPEGPGLGLYPDLDNRLRSVLRWLLMPPKELPPDRESDSQKRGILELLLKLWTNELETSQSLQDLQQVKELLTRLVGQYTNEQEQLSQEQLAHS
jgi:hypothetical protein